MNCPECGISIPSLPCWRCSDEKTQWAQKRSSLIRELSLIDGPPKSAEEQRSLDAAVASIQKRLDAEQFKGKLSFDPHRLLRSRTWWYVPFCWIGCSGFIVDDGDQYVNWLGSAIGLRDCFWGHERGIVVDLVDLTIVDVTDVTVLMALFRRLMRSVESTRKPNKQVMAWYHEAEIPSAIRESYPTFRKHFAWHAIPEIRRFCESGELSFTCTRSR